MPSKDKCYNQVVRALQKANWHVPPEPHSIYVPGKRSPLLADIRAVQNEKTIIIVEVKCFADNIFHELYTAIGQYLLYRSILKQAGSTLPLYLAVPVSAYKDIFSTIAQSVVEEIRMKLLVVDMTKEEIVQWIE